MALATIIQEVTGYLEELYSHEEPGPVTVVDLTTRVGAQYVQAADRPPRVVWVPTGDSYQGAKMSTHLRRPVRTRMAGVAVHVWHDSLANCEDLVNDVVASIHRTAHGCYEIRGGQWIAGAHTNLGFCYVLELTFEIPITLRAPEVVENPSVEADVGIEDAESSEIITMDGG